MKVTKLIREYVTAKVEEVYSQKKSPYAEQAQKDREALKDLTNELLEMQKTRIQQFILEHELFEKSWTGTPKPYSISTHVPSFGYVHTQAMIDDENWQNELKAQKLARTREIMVALELGANRTELNEMIAALLKEGDTDA